MARTRRPLAADHAAGSRCDARCHNARSARDRCSCECRGEFHGCGELEAARRIVGKFGLGPLFTYQAERLARDRAAAERRALEHIRAGFAKAAAVLRDAGLMR